MKKICSQCNRIGIIERGGCLVCKKHYRFLQMRSRAIGYYGFNPSKKELEDLIPAGMICPACNVKMNWLSSDGWKSTISLQHDRSGKLRMICRSCNCRHAQYPGDSFYKLDLNKRLCPKCKKELPFNYFHKSKRRLNGITVYCKTCEIKRRKKRYKLCLAL